MPDLRFSTGDARADRILQGAINLLEAFFPGRIRAYYLVGSYADGSFVDSSDLDLVPLFKGAMQPGETERYWQAVADMDRLSPIHLGFGLRNEDQSFREGGVGIKIGSELVYGEDMRDQIPLTPLEDYRQLLVRTSLDLIAEQRGSPPQLAYPLDYPNPQDLYFGYVKEARTAIIITHLMFLASARVTLKTGRYNASKSFSWRFYQENISDAWGAELEDWYRRGKQQWGYAVPEAEADQQHLRAMCGRALAFENEFLAEALDFIHQRLSNPDEPIRAWAESQWARITGADHL